MSKGLRTVVCVAVLAAAPAAAQGPSGAVEIVAGHAGFVDDATIGHAVVGGAARLQMSPRVSVGPELVYMRGPAYDRNVYLTGNLTFDFRPQLASPPRASPFLVAGAGVFRHTGRIGSTDFSHVEGAVTLGGGVRVMLTGRLYAAGELRVGWEPHLRTTGSVGVIWR